MSENTGNTNPNQKMVLSLGAIQVLLRYLSSRPYGEVFQVVEAIQEARTLESVVAEQTTPTQESTPTQTAV